MTCTHSTSRHYSSILPPLDVPHARKCLMSSLTPKETAILFQISYYNRKRCIVMLTEVCIQICNEITSTPIAPLDAKRFKYLSISPAYDILSSLFSFSRRPTPGISELNESTFVTMTFFRNLALFYKKMEKMFPQEKIDALSTQQLLLVSIHEVVRPWIFNMSSDFRKEEIRSAIGMGFHPYLSLLLTESNTIQPIHDELMLAIHKKDMSAVQIILQHCPLTSYTRVQARKLALELEDNDIADFILLRARNFPFPETPEVQNTSSLIKKIPTSPERDPSISSQNLEGFTTDEEGLTSLPQLGKQKS